MFLNSLCLLRALTAANHFISYITNQHRIQSLTQKKNIPLASFWIMSTLKNIKLKYKIKQHRKLHMISAVQTNILVLKEVASFEIDIEHLLIQNGLMKYFISLSSLYLQVFDSKKGGGCNIMIAFLLCFTPHFFFAQFEPNSLVVFIKKIIIAKPMFRANCFCNSLLVDAFVSHVATTKNTVFRPRHLGTKRQILSVLSFDKTRQV